MPIGPVGENERTIMGSTIGRVFAFMVTVTPTYYSRPAAPAGAH
jgi:hypothetical protein